ncbi:MAG: ABC transporter substrate-binding protein [Candidatus Thorarchaeota archaeon]|nr:ABC transporter substrate-binding protein [Candidatus Thorarchaeota archaeon]
MNRNKTAAIVVTVVVLSSLAVVALWYPTMVPDVRIGYLSQDLHQLALKVAIANGWFEEEGITVQLLTYTNGAYEMDGFQSGQIDMGYLGVAPALIKSINAGINISVLAAVNSEGSSIEVLKSEYAAGHVTKMADLAGKKIYHPGVATVQNFLLRLALNQSGLTVDDVTLETAQLSTVADLLTPDAPAYIAWEPFPSLSYYEGITVPLNLTGNIWPNHPCCVVATSNAFAQTNPDIVQKVVDIHVRAEEWILSHPAEALAIAIDWLGIDESPVSTAFNRIIYNQTLNVAGVEAYLEFLIHEEQISITPAEAAAFLDSFIDLSYLS